MKKLFFFAAFLVAASLTSVNAQCTKSKTAGAKTACCAKTKAATAKAVSADSSIEKRVCAESGKVSYFRNEVCAKSGKAMATEVSFDAATGTFVNVSPTRGAMPAAETASTKKTCTAAQKASCAKTCTKAQKAACQKKCTKGTSTKQANAQMDSEAPARATLTKGEGK